MLLRGIASKVFLSQRSVFFIDSVGEVISGLSMSMTGKQNYSH